MSAVSVNNFEVVSSLPEELGLKIFSYLNADSLTVVNFVCKHWNQLSKEENLKNQLNVKTLYKRVSFIDEAAWQTKVDLAKYGLSFEGYCVNQCKMIKELRTCLAWPIEKIDGVKPGVTVITIPKGLSINKLLALAPPKVFDRLHLEFLRSYGNIVVSNAYTIIITDNVMDETRTKDAIQQVVEIQKHGGERPKAIEKITLLVLNFLIAGKRLYDNRRVVVNGEDRVLYTCTRCEEQVDRYPVVVGSFGSDGFRVSNDCYDDGIVSFGLGAVRKC